MFSCSKIATMEIKSDLSSLNEALSPQKNELQALIQLKKTTIHKEKKEKTKSSTTTTTTTTYTKITSTQAFEKACTGARIQQNRYLKATCEGQSASLDLNDCLYAENGVLIYEAEGEFYDSCSKCKLNYPTWQGKKQPINFECKCYDDDLREIKTNINLQDFVYFDRKLKCANIDPRKLPKAQEIDNCDKKVEISDRQNNSFYKLETTCFNQNSFRLDNCLGNNNGVFDYGKNFGRTCYFCEITKESSVYVLTCDCEDAKGSRRREYKALNQFFEVEKTSKKIICHDPNKAKKEAAKKAAEKKAAAKEAAERKAAEKAAEKKKFDILIKPSKKIEGITIIPKKAEVEKTETTIPATKTTINKIDGTTTHITMKNASINTIKIPILPAKIKEFEIKIAPAKKKKGVEIKMKKVKPEKTEITIPATKKIINKKISETTHITSKDATINTVVIPIEAAIVPKEEEIEEEIETDSGAIIDYDQALSPSDNFMRNCHNFSFGGNTFAAECGSNKKKLELDFNKCLTNINGELKFAKNGNYAKSCKECSVESNGSGIYFLNCKCDKIVKQLRTPENKMPGEANERQTHISLSEKIIITQDTKVLSCLPDLVLENEKNMIECESKSFLPL